MDLLNFLMFLLLGGRRIRAHRLDLAPRALLERLPLFHPLLRDSGLLPAWRLAAVFCRCRAGSPGRTSSAGGGISRTSRSRRVAAGLSTCNPPCAYGGCRQ